MDFIKYTTVRLMDNTWMIFFFQQVMANKSDGQSERYTTYKTFANRKL
jgi:hypothetical protein